MGKRLEFHEVVANIIGITEPDGDSHVYFDPPETVKMRYPCVRYSRKDIDTRYANNLIYKQMTAYELILIDKRADSEYIEKILRLPYCSYDRHYKADNLHHDVFTIYI